MGISMVLGGVTVLIGLIFVRPFISFGQLFAFGSGVLLFVAGWKLVGKVNDILLRVIGLTSCTYAVLDIKSDVIDRPNLRSDAAMLAKETGIPTLIWGTVWITIAIACSVFFLLLASRRQASDDDSWRYAAE